MNNANVSLIIANIFLVGAWVVDDFFKWITLIIMSVIWMITSFVQMHQDMKNLQRKIRILKKMEYDLFIARCRKASIEHFMKQDKPKRKNKK